MFSIFQANYTWSTKWLCALQQHPKTGWHSITGHYQHYPKLVKYSVVVMNVHWFITPNRAYPENFFMRRIVLQSYQPVQHNQLYIVVTLFHNQLNVAGGCRLWCTERRNKILLLNYSNPLKQNVMCLLHREIHVTLENGKMWAYRQYYRLKATICHIIYKVQQSSLKNTSMHTWKINAHNKRELCIRSPPT